MSSPDPRLEHIKREIAYLKQQARKFADLLNLYDAEYRDFMDSLFAAAS